MDTGGRPGVGARTSLCAAAVVVAALGVAALGIWKGSFVAGGGDAFGYVSQADLIAHGTLRIDQQFVRSLPWPFADWSFAPAGYRPGTERGFIVPTYSPGLPLVMAVFQWFGGRQAVFFVVPLLGALCVWMTSALGAAVHGRLTGLLAAVMVAASPSFLYQLMQPLSDVPAAAWWTAALALAVRHSTSAALGAGIAAACAVLTRPNLAPLAAVLAVYLVGRFMRERHHGPRGAIRLAVFVTVVALGCVAVAIINNAQYGSPLSSGYEPFDALYSMANLYPNLDRYPRWLLETQTPFIFLAFAAPWLVRRGPTRSEPPPLALDRVLLLLTFAATVVLSYLFYVPYGRDEWGYLRFLLPAYPALLVLAVAVTVEMAEGLVRSQRAAAAMAALVCLALSAWLTRTAVELGALRVGAIERRYADVGTHVAVFLPANAVFISHLHAGSIRYYADRLTLNHLWLEPRWLDGATQELAARGYRPMIAIEEGEEAAFRARFGSLNELGRLDWPPMAERSEEVRVRIYDPADRARFLRGDRIVTRPIERARIW